MRSLAGQMVFAALLACVIGAFDAEAAPVLCKRKKGTVVVRDPACRAKETQLDLAEFLGKVSSATTADTANALAAPENWHEVGAAGEPAFQNGWGPPTYPVVAPLKYEAFAFYKDHEGVVHLRGAAVAGTKGLPIFQLPVGYRPASERILSLPATCTACSRTDPQGDTVSVSTGELTIIGSDVDPGVDGAVFTNEELVGSRLIFLDGISFRAGS